MSRAIADAEAELFGEALTCHGDFPLSFQATASESGGVDRAIERAETVLRTIALVEDSHGEEFEERGAHELALQRIEAKLNLVLETLSILIRRDAPHLPVLPMRWSRFGAQLLQPRAELPAQGFLILQPVAWMPQRVELPVERIAEIAESDGQQRIWLRFSPLPPALEHALERHLFRLHRREIAATRQHPH